MYMMKTFSKNYGSNFLEIIMTSLWYHIDAIMALY